MVTIPYPEPQAWDNLRIAVGIQRVYWEYSDAVLDLNAAILDRFLKLAEKQAFQPAIIFLPGTGDTRFDKARRTWLRQYAERNSTPFLDLSDPIHNAGDEAFIPKNPHLNPRGHWIVANELRRFITTLPSSRHRPLASLNPHS